MNEIKSPIAEFTKQIGNAVAVVMAGAVLVVAVAILVFAFKFLIFASSFTTVSFK